MHTVRIGMASGVDHWKVGHPCGSKQLLGRFQRLPSMLAAGARIAPVDFADRTIATLIDLVIEVDRQHCGTVSDSDLASIRLVDLDDLLIDDVFPAMILEIACHSHLLFNTYIAGEVVVGDDARRFSFAV